MNANIKHVELLHTIQSEDSDIFKTASVVEILAGPTPEGIYEISPVDATDHLGRKYSPEDSHIYKIKLGEVDFKEVPLKKRATIHFSTPGFNKEDYEDDAIALALKDAWQEKGFVVDKDGYIIDKMGSKGIRVIQPEKITTNKDVRRWVQERVYAGMKKKAILDVADFFFDDEWMKVTKTALSDYMLEPEDRSQTKKEPEGKGRMKLYPGSDSSNKKMDYEHQGEIKDGDGKGGGSQKGDPWASQSEKNPDGTNKRQMGKSPDGQDLKDKSHEYNPNNQNKNKTSVRILLAKISELRNKFHLKRVTGVAGEEEMKKGNEETKTDGQPKEAPKQKGKPKPKEAGKKKADLEDDDSLRERWEVIISDPDWDGETDIDYLIENYNIEDAEEDQKIKNSEEEE